MPTLPKIAVFPVPDIYKLDVCGFVVPIPTKPEIYVILFLGTIATFPAGFNIILSGPPLPELSFSQPNINTPVSVN